MAPGSRECNRSGQNVAPVTALDRRDDLAADTITRKQRLDGFTRAHRVWFPLPNRPHTDTS